MYYESEWCPWFDGGTCSLNRRECSFFYEKGCLYCKKYLRLKALTDKVAHWRGKPSYYYDRLTQKERDYVLFAYRKMIRNSGIMPNISNLALKLFVERCRRDSECPTKALLPEYDLIEVEKKE